MNTDKELIAKRRRMTKERKTRWLARHSQESLDRIRAVDAAADRRLIESQTPSQAQNRREIHAGKQRFHIERQTLAQSQSRREVNATVHRNRHEIKR
ncbi:hypothetical protein AVEN_214233-1 [Araneus ventricosus]|uniref:Uncharacterized protein n=1 Tax=Araneus ventricosus TaxID=182803 RepID=A0A4Y2S1R0_ARAVE|nr:hypothetical protein AVEN_214233-1 [Araneus ventricosus]